ncbi:ATP-binding cassette domain-containing protein [Staphylococcus warneri]|uniref:ABC transporter ATP-binding protein n=2 Tax=Staphylococcus warneri TaxID=1292 RepID=A0A2T4Q338_STAWA|nr:ATP-binding cassette domain-containing protein [Staphylococcus warneri]PTI11856.1 ABC transporter ATP-binding protein [Staphylococcus warneri]PTI25730.1 ABC transporter ATP-binding protein [Staphylococcus warneri]PTI52331.1 ABC transporter ATP-binding protein [Staphylococcus warneri]RIN15038.1 ABC transporter ATP-binding protein [Staphylococcus warneri]
MTTEAIVANHISKSINHKEIINDLSITIPKYSITHIQGHNGTGKTITLQLLAKLIRPTTGNIKVNGRISYAPDYLPNDLNLTVGEYLSFIRQLNHIPINDQALNDMISKMQLEPFLSHRIKNCSKGTQQKVNLIQCLTTKADVYLFDEPFNGLDQSSLAYLLSQLKLLKNKATIILTSHDSRIYHDIITHTFDLENQDFKEMTSTLSEYKIVSFIIENIEDMEDLIYYFKMKYDITISKNTTTQSYIKLKVPVEETNVVLKKLIIANVTIDVVINEEGD